MENWLKKIEIKGGRVLDVGGSQNPVKKRLKIFEPDEYKILDLEKPHECEQKPDIIYDLNKNDLLDNIRSDNDIVIVVTEDIDNKLFDFVFALEVFEYIFNPIQALKNINSFLKKGGLFYSSWHFLYPVHSPTEQDYLRYTFRGVEKLLKKTGFEILEMKPRLFRHNEMWRDFYVSEGMRPAKDYDKHGWQGCLCKCKRL